MALHWAVSLAVVAASACSENRAQPPGEGVHPFGWVDPDSEAFHAKWLHENGDDLSRCRTCHGDDYGGGVVGATCTGAGCHVAPACEDRSGGPEACGTCHGSNDDDPCDPLPSTGAHAKHGVYCQFCHVIPQSVGDAGHIDDEGGGPEITFSGLAVQGDLTPTFDRETKTCRGTYCHVSGSPSWDEQDVPLTCDACHDKPPSSHVRFERVTVADDADRTPRCDTCHPMPPSDTHVDGQRDLDLPDACDTCHGSGEFGAPPPALDGSTDPTTRGAGAHARHVDSAAPDRVAEALTCDSCHPVPDEVLADGHIDAEAPADIALTEGGTWNETQMTCDVWCHGDAGSPVWTESTPEVECDLCHDAPPASHGPFWRGQVPSGCALCHPAPPAATHVDHELEVELASGCSTCHGSNENAAPPNGVDGQPDGPGVGAHQAHLNSALGAPVVCETCHVVPAEVTLGGADGHIDGRPAEVRLPDRDGIVGVYDPGARTCAVWCHGGPDRDLPVWTDRSTVFCGSCHDLPPPNHLGWVDFVPDIADINGCDRCHTTPPAPTHIDGAVTGP